MVKELKRGIWGPFEGTIYFADDLWIFIHTDGSPIYIASSLTELWDHLKKNGLINIKEIFCFLVTRHYICDQDLDLDKADKGFIEYLESIPPEKVLTIQRFDHDEPIITLSEIPRDLIPKIMTGEVDLQEVARVVGQ